MSTREQALTAAKILSGLRAEQVGTGVIHDAIRRVCECVEQEPDAALWAEIDGLLGKLNKENPGNALELVRANFPISGAHWLIVTRSGDAMDGWVPVGSSGWKSVPTIRDQLHELATERGLLTPSLEEIQAIVESRADDCVTHFSQVETAKLKAFIAALAAKEGER